MWVESQGEVRPQHLPGWRLRRRLRRLAMWSPASPTRASAIHVLMLLHLPVRVHTLSNGLSPMPAMGWRSWNFMKQNVSQAAILRQVDALVAKKNGWPSLLEVGYNHIGIGIVPISVFKLPLGSCCN